MLRLACTPQSDHIHLVPTLGKSVAILLDASVAFIEGVGHHGDLHRDEPELNKGRMCARRTRLLVSHILPAIWRPVPAARAPVADTSAGTGSLVRLAPRQGSRLSDNQGTSRP